MSQDQEQKSLSVKLEKKIPSYEHIWWLPSANILEKERTSRGCAVPGGRGCEDDVEDERIQNFEDGTIRTSVGAYGRTDGGHDNG